eukprot:CAMPEP_0201475604 /NCGR_PEP_ID=MMETSP0151_2-20130828/993_1 /ASSEMBLY_ACC=CAM_ASM_000257 /TAXON_ID=200890 /ORGANISM="Paramoeba atlantica, Strain 621/1 / CCAP 1560/9" /LENGTH=122 /DNA_ID=CAMNT_0047855735 /DNA_START=29 /DNA_END=397 /DNA_ORIENTATION=-
MEAEQKAIEQVVAEYKKAHEDSQKLAQNSSKLQTQINENEMVKRELDLIVDETKVYKLVGSVLVPQEIGEARSNVGKRLEYIRGEEERTKKRLQDIQEEQQKRKEKVMAFQAKMEQAKKPQK